MGRESLNEGTEVVVRSSIALLQERFRELQRVKTMREQREVSRTIALYEQEKHSMHYKPADEAVRLFLNPSTSDHHRRHHHHHHLHQVQLALAHGHVSSPPLHLHKRKRNEEEYYIHKRRRRSVNETSSVLINLWPELAVDRDSPSCSSSSWNKLETTSDCDDSDHDVDTSLHL